MRDIFKDKDKEEGDGVTDLILVVEARDALELVKL